MVRNNSYCFIETNSLKMKEYLRKEISPAVLHDFRSFPMNYY